MVKEMEVSPIAVKKPRLTDIDQAKGLGIFLVVLGHIVARPPGPLDAHWYEVLKAKLYGFHMPFFIFLSGLVFFYTYRPLTSIQAYSQYVNRRFMRLMPAYFLFALIIWCGKFIAAKFIYVDNPVKGADDFIKLFLYPRDNYVSFLWYIYILFLLNALVPILLWCSQQRFLPILIVSAILPFIPVPIAFGLNVICQYLVFFLLGGWVIANYEKYTTFLDHYRWIVIAVFFMVLVLVNPQQMWLMLGLLSLPALHALVRQPVVARWNFLALWGEYTFAIYLMNTIAIGVCKAFITKITTWDGPHFFFVAPLLLLGGIFLPILAKRYVFVRIPWLNKMIW